MSNNIIVLGKTVSKSALWHNEDTIKAAFENADRVLINRDGIREAKENEPFADGIMFQSAPTRSVKQGDGEVITIYRMMVKTSPRTAARLRDVANALANDVVAVRITTKNAWIVETDNPDALPRIASTCMDVYYG